MKRFPLSILLLAGGVALFLAGTWCGRRGVAPATAGTERQVLYYVDPMNPAHTSVEPGLAPCGMKMEPVYADARLAMDDGSQSGQVAGSIRVSPQRQQLFGIRVATVEKSPVTHTLRFHGRVVPEERRVYRLNAGVDGIIREVSEAATGVEVKKDQWLATFSAPDARPVIQNFLTALDVLDRQKKSGAESPAQVGILTENIRLAADRLQNLGLSPLQIDEIRAAREVPVKLRILAPEDGVVLAQNVSPGYKFEKGVEWCRIADLSRVWVVADVLATEAEYLKPGAEARVSAPGRQKSLPARVSESLPQFDPATRTLKARFELENPGLALRPDMYVEVVLPLTLPPAVAVAADAVLDSGLAATVFVCQGDGCFEPRQVETGRRLGDRIEILSGLEPGEQIAVSGNFLLDSESRMKLAAGGNRQSGSKDPVCGMKVTESAARAADRVSQYEGISYYFCNRSCKEAFDESPLRFARKPGLARAAARIP
jgi:RND family efflux transporter MFP subunit